MRERIRLQALAVYNEAGLEAVSIRAVAKRAGMSPAGIYSFFASRQALIEALWLDPVRAMLDQMVVQAAATPDPLVLVRLLLDLFVRFSLANPEILRGAFLRVRPTKESAPSPRPLHQLDFHRLLAEAIAEGQTSGHIRPGDPALMAQALWAGLHGALAIPIHMEAWGLSDPQSLAEEVTTLLMTGLLDGAAHARTGP